MGDTITAGGNELQSNTANYTTPPLEENLALQWGEGVSGQQELRTSDGMPLVVVYRGRRTVDHGPDFRDAILATAPGDLLRGDVEIHRYTADWRRHGHHQDASYNNVVLHVVWRDDTGRPALRADGTPVPTLVWPAMLSDASPPCAWLGTREHLLARPPCRSLAARPEHLAHLLDVAGEQRFAGRIARFISDLSGVQPGELFYRGLADALGYSRNRLPFVDLAGRMPLPWITEELHRYAPSRRLHEARALVLGTAGFLTGNLPPHLLWPLTPGDVESLAETWDRRPAVSSYPGPWQFFRARPQNYPTRRALGLSSLLAGSIDDLLDALSCGVRHAAHPSARAAVMAPLQVREAFPAGGLDGNRSISLVGAARAAEITINVLLPLCAAWSDVSGDEELGAAARLLYATLPAGSANELQRHMLQEVLGSGLRPSLVSARRQQGLLHIYHHFCRGRHCYECTLRVGAGAGRGD